MLVEKRQIGIPELTKNVALKAFPQKSAIMRIRDELGDLFEDADFKELYPAKGQPTVSPAQLAMVTLLQYMENLTDRDAALAVRARIDWKYALGLELTDAGFHYSVLSEFRQRLLSGGKEKLLLEKVIERCEEKGLLTGKAKQRTDSTHVIAKIRIMNRIELVGETMRCALNEIALADPEWLRPKIQAEWGKRYSQKIETSRLSQNKQSALKQQIGKDGMLLLQMVYSATSPEGIKCLQSIETLRAVWVQHYYQEQEKVVWRIKKEHGIPPSSKIIASPYESDARYAAKGTKSWTGYKVHLTETCEDETPNLITHVETTIAPKIDLEVTEKIQEDLCSKNRKPDQHICDGAYVDAEIVVKAAEKGIDVIGPVHQDSSWQAKNKTGYDLANFKIDWEAMTATCPNGEVSSRWKKRTNVYGKPDFRFEFRFQTCNSCSARDKCTRSKKQGRHLTVYPQIYHEALTTSRQHQATKEFKRMYNKRAGVEGTVSQAVRKFGVRKSRYRGLQKTHLQHLATAAAINLKRVSSWLAGEIPEQTRISHFAALAFPL